jgi:hypothetical protein
LEGQSRQLRLNFMNENQGTREKQQADTAAEGKKPYQKPSFRYERVFETLALACAKQTGVGGCDGTPRHKS